MPAHTFPRSTLSRWIAVLSIGSVAPLVSAAESDGLMEEIIVMGVRGSQEAAVDVKRNSAQIVDSIVAEDIGRLPDVTIADSLQRVTGVQIQRDAGEGTALNVRGMPQVLTTLNGEQFLSPWSITDVQANYSDIPAGMVSSVDVIKSQSASMISGGISGVVDLKTRQPLAMPLGVTGSIGVEASEGSMTERANHNVNGFVGWNNGEVAFTLSAFNTRSHSANYGIDEETRLGFVNSGGDPLDINGSGRNDDLYIVSGGYGIKSYVMERERTGLAGSLEFDVGLTSTVSADLFYTRMDQYDRGVEGQFDGSNNQNYDVLRPGSITRPEGMWNPGSGPRELNSVQVAVIDSPSFQATSANLQNETEALNGSIKWQFEPGGPFSGSVQYNFGTAERLNEQARLQQGTPEWQNNTGDGIPENRYPFDVVVDFRPHYPVFELDDDMSHLGHLSLYQGIADGFKQNATLNTLRADGRYDLDSSGMQSVEFGLRFSRRDVDTAHFVYMTPTGRDPSNELLPSDLRWQRYPDWQNFYGDADLGIERSDSLIYSLARHTDFGPFRGWEDGIGAVEPRAMDNIGGFMEELYPGARRFDQPARRYEVIEDEASAFAQYNFASPMRSAVDFDGNIGLRVVHTEREVIQSITDTSVSPERGTFWGGGYPALQGEPEAYNLVYRRLGEQKTDADFTHVLPMANINFYPSEDVILRASYNQTLARNNLADVGETEALWFQRYRVYSETGSQQDSDGRYDIIWGVGGGNDQGNPDIEPWQASNYNLSAEWYFTEGGLLAVGAFLIKVDTATQTVQESREYPDADGEVRRSSNIWVTRNMAASDLKGIELGYRQAMDFLPGIWGRTGVEFNYTYSDSDSGDSDLFGGSFPLPSNSEHQTNLVLWYQDTQWSGRIAYNWRSDVYLGQVGVLTNEGAIDMGRWTESAGYLDASVNYDLNENFTFYLQGTNLTETSNRNYAQFKDQFHSMSAQERRIAIGMRARF